MSKCIIPVSIVLIAVFAGSATLPDLAYCKGESRQEKLLMKQNKEAMGKAPIKKNGKWRPFTRLIRPGEDIGKNGIKKGTFLLTEHKKGRPSLNKYKEDTGIDNKRKGKIRVEGFYQPSVYKQSDIKGKGTKSYSKQEMPMKYVPPGKVRITSRTLLR